MTIYELRELIHQLPDDMPVVTTTHQQTVHPRLTIRTVKEETRYCTNGEDGTVYSIKAYPFAMLFGKPSLCVDQGFYPVTVGDLKAFTTELWGDEEIIKPTDSEETGYANVNAVAEVVAEDDVSLLRIREC